MKKIFLLPIFLIILLLQSCKDTRPKLMGTRPDFDSIEWVIPKNVSEFELRSPISKKHLVVEFTENFDTTQKNNIRSENKIKSYYQCPCNDKRFEVWEFDHEINTNSARNNLKSKEGEIEGDFLYKLSIDDKLAEIELPRANKQTSDKGVSIAIIDTGIDYDFLDSIYINSYKDCNNTDFGINILEAAPPLDNNNHGSLVTKVLVNELGKNKVPYNILPVKAFDKNGKGTYWDIVCAFNALSKVDGLNIINASFGFYGYPEVENQDILFRLIAKLKDNGVLTIASAGNQGVDTDVEPHFPSGYKNVFSVGGFKSPKCTISIHSDSNYGDATIDIATKYEQYLKFNQDSIPLQGTSFGTPLVSALAAKMIYEGITNPDIVKEKVLVNEAKVIDTLKMYIQKGKAVLTEECK